MVGKFRDWDGVTGFDSIPLFYEGVDEWTGNTLMMGIGDEMMAIKAALSKKTGGRMKFTRMFHIKDWLQHAYKGQIKDESSLRSALNTNRGYLGMKHTMIETKTGKYVPNFKVRYLTEDVPYGLLFNKGVAKLVGVMTPNIDFVILTCQKFMKTRYIAETGDLLVAESSSDGAYSRAPQQFGINSFEELLRFYLPQPRVLHNNEGVEKAQSDKEGGVCHHRCDLKACTIS